MFYKQFIFPRAFKTSKYSSWTVISFFISSASCFFLNLQGFLRCRILVVTVLQQNAREGKEGNKPSLLEACYDTKN